MTAVDIGGGSPWKHRHWRPLWLSALSLVLFVAGCNVSPPATELPDPAVGVNEVIGVWVAGDGAKFDFAADGTVTYADIPIDLLYPDKGVSSGTGEWNLCRNEMFTGSGSLIMCEQATDKGLWIELRLPEPLKFANVALTGGHDDRALELWRNFDTSPEDIDRYVKESLDVDIYIFVLGLHSPEDLQPAVVEFVFAYYRILLVIGVASATHGYCPGAIRWVGALRRDTLYRFSILGRCGAVRCGAVRCGDCGLWEIPYRRMSWSGPRPLAR